MRRPGSSIGLVGEVIESRDGRRPQFTRQRGARRVDLIELARERGVSGDPVVRQRLAGYFALTEIHRLNADAGAGLRATRSNRPGPEGSISKLALGEICRASRDLSFAILGADTMLSGPDAPGGGEFQTVGLWSPGVTIGAGTDEIQRNILGERILGLPHEPEADRGVPFKDLRVGTQQSG